MLHIDVANCAWFTATELKALGAGCPLLLSVCPARRSLSLQRCSLSLRLRFVASLPGSVLMERALCSLQINLSHNRSIMGMSNHTGTALRLVCEPAAWRLWFLAEIALFRGHVHLVTPAAHARFCSSCLALILLR